MREIARRIERVMRAMLPASVRKNSFVDRAAIKAMPIELIVHVGAHFAEDADKYEAFGAKTVVWVEADPVTYAKLQTILSLRHSETRHIAHLALVSAESGNTLNFNRFSGDGGSSSVYHSTDTYRARFPLSLETGESLSLKTQTLPEILATYEIDPAAQTSMLVLDVQGHEMAVLKGIADMLDDFALCKTEVSRIPMYENGARFDDLDALLNAHEFDLASHWRLNVPRHGDVMYRRRAIRP